MRWIKSSEWFFRRGVRNKIVTDIKAGLKPDYDDLRYSVLALDVLLYFEGKQIRDAADYMAGNDKIWDIHDDGSISDREIK